MQRVSIGVILILITAATQAGAADYYVCDCGRGAHAACQPGDDQADGTTPATPWRTYDQAQDRWRNLAAGDAIRFCRGGAFEIEGQTSWINRSCRADQPCEVSDYLPPWGAEVRRNPMFWQRRPVTAFSLANPGPAEHEEGYIFRNLDLRCTACEAEGDGFFLYNDIDDVLLEGLFLDGFANGVQLGGSEPCSPEAGPLCNGRNERITLRGSTIVNSAHQGWLGSGDGTLIEGNWFEGNGTRPIFDHNLYYSNQGGETSGSRIVDNVLFRSTPNEAQRCEGVSLVVHGRHHDLTIAGNRVFEEIGMVELSCWGIAVDPGYEEAEGFTGVVVRDNLVRNLGGVGIGLASCQDCRVEHNVVVQGQRFASVAIAVPDRERIEDDLPLERVVVESNLVAITGSRGSTGLRLGSEGTGHTVTGNKLYFLGRPNDWTCMDLGTEEEANSSLGGNQCYTPGQEPPTTSLREQ